MYQQEFWEKATECVRAIECSSDPVRREMLTNLRDMWINLANESEVLTEIDVARQVAAMTQLQADLTKSTETSTH